MKELSIRQTNFKGHPLDYASTHRSVVERCKHGDRQAQFELYRLYSQAMYNVCLRMLKNETDAEDILQTSFLDVFAKLGSFRYESAIGAWIKRIVINNCINFIKRNRMTFEQIDERKDAWVDGAEEVDFEPRFSVQAIQKAIMALPDGYRVVFSLYVLEGYDHQEIAEILKITEATSKSQFSRARKKLKEILLEGSSIV